MVQSYLELYLYIHSTLLKAVGQVSLNNEEGPSSVVTTPEGQTIQDLEVPLPTWKEI